MVLLVSMVSERGHLINVVFIVEQNESNGLAINIKIYNNYRINTMAIDTVYKILNSRNIQ